MAFLLSIKDNVRTKYLLFRCFIVVPRGAGFCIINEILHVTFPTAANAKRAFTSPESSMQTLNKPQVLVINKPQVLVSLDNYATVSGIFLDFSSLIGKQNSGRQVLPNISNPLINGSVSSSWIFF